VKDDVKRQRGLQKAGEVMLGDNQMPGRADRKKFRKALHEAQNNRDEKRHKFPFKYKIIAYFFTLSIESYEGPVDNGLEAVLSARPADARLVVPIRRRYQAPPGLFLSSVMRVRIESDSDWISSLV